MKREDCGDILAEAVVALGEISINELCEIINVEPTTSMKSQIVTMLSNIIPIYTYAKKRVAYIAVADKKMKDSERNKCYNVTMRNPVSIRGIKQFQIWGRDKEEAKNNAQNKMVKEHPNTFKFDWILIECVR